MDTTELEVKDEEPKEEVKEKGVKDRFADFLRRNKKKIIIGGTIICTVIAGVVVYKWVKSSEDSDEDNEIMGDGYDDSYDYNTPTELDEGSASQTQVRRKHRQRDIGGIDITGSSLMDYEKKFLENLSSQYDRFIGKEQTLVDSYDSFCSDGKYTRETTTNYSFLEDDMGIKVNIRYKDDDGQTGEITSKLVKGRDIINFFKENKNLRMFDDVHDIVDMYPKAESET